MEEILNVNDRDFLVVNKITYNNTNYLYLVADDDSNDVALVKEKMIDNETFIESVRNREEFDEVMTLIVQQGL